MMSRSKSASGHADRYRELSAPGVTAGSVRAVDPAGYHNGLVSVCQSMHVLPSHGAVRELMPALSDALREEPYPAAVSARTCRLRVHPSLLRWQRPHGPFSDERHTPLRWLCLNRDHRWVKRRLRGRTGASARAPEYRTVCAVYRCINS